MTAKKLKEVDEISRMGKATRNRTAFDVTAQRLRYSPSLVTLTAGVATNPCGIDLAFPYWDGK